MSLKLRTLWQKNKGLMIQKEEATNESQKDVGAEELGAEDSIRRGYK